MELEVVVMGTSNLYSQLAGSTGNNMGLQLASEVGVSDSLVALNP